MDQLAVERLGDQVARMSIAVVVSSSTTAGNWPGRTEASTDNQEEVDLGYKVNNDSSSPKKRRDDADLSTKPHNVTFATGRRRKGAQEIRDLYGCAKRQLEGARVRHLPMEGRRVRELSLLGAAPVSRYRQFGPEPMRELSASRDC